MNKAELVKFISEKAGINKTHANSAFGAVVEAISSSLASGNDIVVAGLGTFKVKTVPAHAGRHPATGETIQVPEKRVVKFKSGAHLKGILG